MARRQVRGRDSGGGQVNAISGGKAPGDRQGLDQPYQQAGRGPGGERRRASRLIAELPNLPEFARLVLVESETLSDSNRVLKSARTLENGYVRAYRKPRNLTQWIKERARQEYDAEISPRAAQAIASLVNDDCAGRR